MKMWEILVPTVRNDGRPIRTAFHRIWDSKVRSLTNGLTILKPAIGHWLDEDKTLYKERMIPVRIMADEVTINKVMDFTARYYDQKAVLAYVVSEECLLKEYDFSDLNPTSPSKEQFEVIEMAGKKCENPLMNCDGVYIVKTLLDDMQGYVTCDKCNNNIKSRRKVKTGR